MRPILQILYIFICSACLPNLSHALPYHSDILLYPLGLLS